MTEGTTTENAGFRHIANALVKARRAKKLKFAAVTDAIRVREDYLRAMEAGDFDQLPGGVYTRSHLKAYAEYLGLDSTPLLAELDKELGIVQEEEAETSAEPYRASFSPNPWVIAASLAGCVVLYLLWQADQQLPPAPPSKHVEKVVAAFTEPKPEIVVVATAAVQVKATDEAGAILFDKVLEEGDTFYAPEESEVTLLVQDAAKLVVYIEGAEVQSLNLLLQPDGSLPLNREKLLANAVIQ